MTDQPTDPTPASTVPARRRIDPVALVAGLGTLLVAAYVLTDGLLPLPPIPGHWLLAGGVAFLALLLLLASFNRRG